jgi:hypothetical protein
VLSGFVADGDWSPADAIRVVDLIARDNAARIYQLNVEVKDTVAGV